MSSVGIVTIYDERNYGNRLQNYAVNEVVRQLGFCPVNLLYEGSVNEKFTISIKCWLYDMIYNRLRSYHRLNLFKKFTKEHMPCAQVVKDDTKVDCRYVLCGSDQIWNPTWAGYGFYFAPFVKQEKRIAYAASFGVSRIPNDRVQEYTSNLKGMHTISVREEAGAEIVEELTGSRPVVLVDPTMMLDHNEWEKLAKKPHFYNGEKYILTYFLGNVTSEMRNYIEKISVTYSMEVINLEKKMENDYWYNVGPSEFIWLIQHCELMLTDSFHGSVFSVLMSVPFLVFEKIEAGLSSSSRIDTLLRTLDLTNRKFNYQVGDEVFEKDYDHVWPILEKKRSETIEYLKSAMKDSEDTEKDTQ